MSVFSFSRDTISTVPILSAIAGGTTTASGTLFFKIYNQNLAGNNFGSNPASVSWTAGQQVRVQVPTAMRATGEFVERFVIAGSPSGNAGTWVQLAVIEAMDANGAPLALPLTVDLSSDYDLSFVKSAATVAALPTTARLGALTTIAALGGSVYRFEATSWPIPADGIGVIAVAGGRWVKHYGTFNPEPVSMAGAGGQRQNNGAIATPTKLIGYLGGSFSRSFYYSVYNDSATQDLIAGTNIGLTVLADGQPVTAQLSGRIEITLVGYVGANGVLDTAPASGLPSLLYDYTNVGQVFLPTNLPSGSQAVYRLRFNYSAVDFSQPVRSILVNLQPYATAPTQAPWAGLAGDSFIADSGGRFRFFPGLGLSGQVDDGQITVNRYQSPVTPEQIVVGFAASTTGQLAITNATGQVLRQPGGYTLGTAEIMLATVGTIAGEHIRTNLGSVTLSTAGGVNVTVTNPVDVGGRATVRANYSDNRIAGISGFCRFNPISVAIYLTSGGTTYRTVVTPLNQTSQVFTLNAPGSTVAAPVATNFGLFDPTGASATTTTGTIPAGTYQISIGYVYDGNQITSIAHNPSFSIYNGNAAGILGIHEATYNHGSFINLAQAQALVDAHTTAFNHANFATNSGVAATYLTQANAATLYKPLTADDSVATGLRFALKTVTTGTPANGEIQFNNATLSSVTSLLIAETGRDGSSIPTLLDMLQQTTRIIIQVEQNEDLYAWFNITGAPVDSGTYRTVPVAFVTAPTGVTTIANLGTAGAELTLDFYGVGNSGASVPSGQAYILTTGATTNSGQIRFASGVLYIHESDRTTPTAVNLTTLWQNLKPGSIIQIFDETAPANYANYVLGTWTGNPPKPGTVYELPATASGSNGTIANATNVRISAALSGTNGTNGTTVGQAYAFSTGASTSAGSIRENGTNLEIHESDRNAAILSTLWDTLTPGSSIQLKNEVNATQSRTYVLGTWAGAVPKTAGVYILPFTSIIGSAIANATNIVAFPSIKGAQGAPGSGSNITVEEIDGNPSFAASTLRFPNASVTQNGPIATIIFATATGRQLLSSTLTVYVRQTGGNDANDGLSVANAFATLQKAVDYIASLDIGLINPTINAIGAFPLLNLRSIVGSGTVNIIGGGTQKTDCIINGIKFASGNGIYFIDNLHIQNSAGYGIDLQTGDLTIGNINYGTCTDSHNLVTKKGLLQSTGAYSISGGAFSHFAAYDLGSISFNVLTAATITITGTPNFPGSFAIAARQGAILAVNQNYSGSATGPRRSISTGGSCTVVGGAGSGSANYFPGNSAGTVDTGTFGIYG